MKGGVAVILRQATERQRRTEIEVLDRACRVLPLVCQAQPARRCLQAAFVVGGVGVAVGQVLADFKGQWQGHGRRLLVQHLSGCGCEDSFSRENNK